MYFIYWLRPFWDVFFYVNVCTILFESCFELLFSSTYTFIHSSILLTYAVQCNQYLNIILFYFLPRNTSTMLVQTVNTAPSSCQCYLITLNPFPTNPPLLHPPLHHPRPPTALVNNSKWYYARKTKPSTKQSRPPISPVIAPDHVKLWR